MQLLFQRGQGRSFLGRPVFNLLARFELTEEEAALINKYHVKRHILIEGNFIGDVLRSAKWAVLVSLAIFIFVTQSTGIFNGFRFGLVSHPLATIFIYAHIRERIRVWEILDGRFFACRSVAMLMHKEQAVTQMTIMFRQFLEAMKTWGGREIIAIEPDKLPMIRLNEPYHGSS